MDSWERKIDMTRDLRFLEGSKKQPREWYEDFTVNEDSVSQENEVDFPVKSNGLGIQNNGYINQNANEEGEIPEEYYGQNENEDEDNHSHNQDDERENTDNEDNASEILSSDEDVTQENEARRGPGRPRKLYTGARERPRKQYQTVHNVEEISPPSECVVCLAEIPIRDAIKGPELNKWLEAMAIELKSTIKNNTWTIIDRLKNHQIVGSRVVLRNKYNSDGTLERRKARIVAKGFSQHPGIDFNKTFAPVASIGSISMVLAISAQYGMEIKQFDVTTAYLNGVLQEKIFMEIPEYTKETLEMIVRTERSNNKTGVKAKEMLRNLENVNKVCHLKKALYGLRQAGRQWYMRLNEELQRYGILPSKSDPCLFYSG